MFAERIQDKLNSLAFIPARRGTSRTRKDSTPTNETPVAAAAKKSPIASPRCVEEEEEEDLNDTLLDRSSIRVVVRCRPSQTEDANENFEVKKGTTRPNRVNLRLGVPDAYENSPSYTRALDEHGLPKSATFPCNAFMDADASVEAVFDQCAYLIERAVEGYSGSILCYGPTGAGKSHTMYGTQDPASIASSSGLLQRTSERVFQCVSDKSKTGDVFIVEASYLHICASKEGKEQIVDLLTSSDTRNLEVRQDPFVPGSWLCDGLKKEAVRSAEDISQAISKGQRRHAELVAGGQVASSRVHTLVILTIECLSMTVSASETTVQRGKLILADLAGSEDGESTRGSLAALGKAMSTGNEGQMQGHKDSLLTQLLCDCIGGSPRSGCVLVANIDSELSHISETVNTLMFARRFVSLRTVSAGAALSPGGGGGDTNGVRGHDSANAALVDTGAPNARLQDHLKHMKDKNRECIRMLQEKVLDQTKDEAEERNRISKDIGQIHGMMNQMLTTQEVEDRKKSIEETRQEMQQAMSQEFEKWRKDSLQESAAKLASMEAELLELRSKIKAAEDEAVGLRIKYASSEERAKYVTARLEELQSDRNNFEDERKNMRTEKDQQWERLTTAESNLFKARADAEVQRAEVARLQAARAEEEDNFRREKARWKDEQNTDQEAFRREREMWREEKSQLEKEVSQLRHGSESAKRDSEVRVLQVEKQQQEETSKLSARIARLEAEAQVLSEKLVAAQDARERLEAERDQALSRQEEIRIRSSEEVRRVREQWNQELGEMHQREAELMHMLQEVQESIITSGGQPHFHDSEASHRESP
eukprot:TRINITY_DN10360_c0_g1_i1.p1 TRINITY_DN10360_c0_g1~~TRINITY_DN10360_c0_g1_i1.p1  ORF type:complete len:823 (-),score=252.97 TRINITY_DN10360_c0_g1_i1:368-2836(-)